MHGEPYHPGNEARETDFTGIYNCIGAPHSGQVAFVAIMKRLIRLLARNPVGNHRSHVASALHSDRGNAGKRLAVLRGAASITNHKNVWGTGDPHAACYLYPTSTIPLRCKPFAR